MRNRNIARMLGLAVCVACAARGAWAADSAVKVTALSVEHAAAPMGIGESMPRLSWKLQSTQKGEMQTAYEIRAWRSDARDTGPAPAGGPVPALWASGKVASDQSVLVPWGGPALGSRTPVTWTVRIWDKDGNATDWSEPAKFETGLLRGAEEWKGQWITADLPRVDIEKPLLAKANWISAGSTPMQAAGTRYALNLPEGARVVSASIDVAADGLVALYVNGQVIRQGSSSHTAPFHADFPGRLAGGKNLIAVSSAAVRNATRGTPGRNALAAHLSVELAGGQRLELDSDGTWKAAVAPTGAWYAPDFDDSQWAAATVHGPYVETPPRPSADGTVGPGRYLRKTFTVKPGLAKARLYSTALGDYEASINGKPINDHLLSPGWTDYAQRVMVQTTDVTGLLTPGQNAMGALVGDGWFAGRVGWAGLAQYAQVSTRPLFNAQLELTYGDGSTEVIATDATWKAGAGEMVGSDPQLGEVIDHQKAAGWDMPGFDESAWRGAVVEQASPALAPQVGPPVRRLMELAPAKITRIGNMYVVDFGQNMVGHVRLTARGAAGTTIRVTHGETINADGTIYNENLRQAISLDTFTLGGQAGAETFEPHFTFHGFRYAQIIGYPGELTADSIRGVVIGSDCPATGTFECSNADVNRLYQNIVWGQRGNFISVPTDCPQRDERMGWMGDAQVFAPTAARNSDVSGFFMKWMQDINEAQRPDGAFSNVSPRARENQSYPVWADAGVIIPWAMYTAYGDKAFLEKNYDHMKRYVDYNKRTYPTLLPTGGVGDHLAPMAGRGALPGAGRGTGTMPQTAPASRGGAMLQVDPEGRFYISAPASGTAPATATGPATGRAGRGVAGGAGRGAGAFGGGVTQIVDTAYFARSAWIVSQSARLLGKADEAAQYEQLFQEICAAFNKAFVQPDGSITGGTQTCYVLALQFNLLPETLRTAAAGHLTEDVQERQHLTTGFVGVGFINVVLGDLGRADLAYQLLLQDTYPSWLFTVKQGATTMWERWDGYTPERGYQDSSMNSFNHYSFGAVGYWLYSGAAGIQADEAHPGYKHFVLAPQVTDRLSFVRASIDSPYGVIKSAWQRDDAGRYSYDVTVPANTTAEVVLPAAPGSVQVDGKPAAVAGERFRMPVTAGTYHFTFAPR